jgi:predicted Rossmann fold nucleotide-binding protein DprA/Smf involved in DNA uptake
VLFGTVNIQLLQRAGVAVVGSRNIDEAGAAFARTIGGPARRISRWFPAAPDAGFSVGAAMGRNKLIYGLAEFAVVVSSDHQAGGTWAGAVEALKAGWCPVLVREDDGAPKGNRELLKLGATALPAGLLSGIPDLSSWMKEHRRETCLTRRCGNGRSDQGREPELLKPRND